MEQHVRVPAPGLAEPGPASGGNPLELDIRQFLERCFGQVRVYSDRTAAWLGAKAIGGGPVTASVDEVTW